MLALADGPRGAQSLRVRRWVEHIVKDIEPRDALSQIAAVYYWYLRNYGYLRDPIPAEMVRDPEAVIEDIERTGKFLGDCDCAATFLTGALRSIGIEASPIRVGFRAPQYVSVGKTLKPYGTPYTHVLAIAQDQYGRSVVVDPVADGRTHSMIRRTVRFG